MARFLFAVWPAAGHVYPSLPIALALRAAGHTVGYVTLPAFEHLLAAQDVAYFPAPRDATAEGLRRSTTAAGEDDTGFMTYPQAATSPGGAGSQGHDGGPAGSRRSQGDGGEPAGNRRSQGDGGEPAGNRRSQDTYSQHDKHSQADRVHAVQTAYSALFVDPAPAMARCAAQAIDAFAPDVLVHDHRNWGPALAAERAGLPLATLAPTGFLLHGDDLAPFGLGLPPARDAATRARYAAMRACADATLSSVMARWNILRASLDLPPHEGSLATAGMSRQLLLLLGVPELDYDRAELPPHVQYTGHCAWDPPAALAEETTAWLADLPPELPLVLVTASTATRPADRRSAAIVEAALTGLDDLGVGVLATLPFDHPLHGAPLPPHMRLEWFVPHARVLPRASAVVTHGGFGLVTKALGHGLPLVVVPYVSDQPEVAQRVVVAGAGLRLDPAALTPAALRTAVSAALSEDGYRAGAARVAAALARRDGPAEAAQRLVRFAAEHAIAGRPHPAARVFQ